MSRRSSRTEKGRRQFADGVVIDIADHADTRTRVAAVHWSRSPPTQAMYGNGILRGLHIRSGRLARALVTILPPTSDLLVACAEVIAAVLGVTGYRPASSGRLIRLKNR